MLVPVTLINPASDAKLPTPPQLVLIDPPTTDVVMTPVTVSRLNVPVMGSSSEALARQSNPPGPLILHATPIDLATMLVIAGSVPAKLEYAACHGNVSIRIVAVPVEHGPSVALLTKPVSLPEILATVLV